MNSKKRIVIYQLLVRLFGNSNQTNKPWGTIQQNGCGKFSDISEKALEVLKNQGYTHLWYTGVLSHATLTDYSTHGLPANHPQIVKGRAGSPYAIRDYYDINPDYADNVDQRMSEFESLIDRTHKMGLKAIIDFVPNHLAREYHSSGLPKGVSDFGENDNKSPGFYANNNFYYLEGDLNVPKEYLPPTLEEARNPYQETPSKASGNDVFSNEPSVNDWFETIKLNYGVDYQSGGSTHFDPIPDTWKKMREILLFWADKKVDAFRCDMAEMVPLEFWSWVTREVKKKHPDILFISEAYQHDLYRPYLDEGGFDYLYDKVDLYDTLKGIIQGHQNADAITDVWQRMEGIEDKMLRFLENHDEQRIASPDFAGDPKKGIPMMALSAFMSKGPVMMYMGQELGEPAKGASGFSGDDGRTTIFDYWSVPEHTKWVNQGKFDNELLEDWQINLQNSYSEILRRCNDCEALRVGSFFDLQYFNRSHEYTGYSDLNFAFLRYHEEERLLIIINFGETLTQLKIKIPALAWELMGYKHEDVIIDNKTYSLSQLSDPSSDVSFEYNLEAYSYDIISIKPQQ